MSLQYVEFDASPNRHIFKNVLNGRGRKGSKQALTVCGKPFAVDDSIIFSQPTSTLMGEDKPRPPCTVCNGIDDETPAVESPAAAKSPAPDAVIVWMSPSDLCPSPLNHRKTFDKEKLEELAASLVEKGMISPLTARPRPATSKAKEPYEIVVGERRWRASLIGKLERVPVIVRDLTDKEVLEIQLIENVQRVDVHPLEEADGYQALIEKHKYTIEQIAAKTGRSSSYVRSRLKLTDLCKEARETFLEGDLTPAVALMIARIPDAKLQKQATAEVLGLGNWDAYRDSGVQKHHLQIDDGKHETVPLSQREAQVHLQRKYTLRLSLAKFATDDATLVPKAGACSACVHRTGNQADLFADMKSEDSCTKPECFEEKKAADWKRKSAAAAKDGVRVLSEKETKNVFDQYGPGVSIQYNSAYVDPKEKVPYEIDPSGKKTWSSLLGTTEVAKAVALDGAGQARTLIDRTSAIAALKKSGKLKAAKAEGLARSGGNNHRDEQKKREVEAKRKKRAAELGAEHIVAAIKKPELSLEQWRWLATCALDEVDSEDLKRVARRRGIELGTNHMRDGVRKVFVRWLNEPARTSVDLLGMVAEGFSQHRAAAAWTSGYGTNIQGAAKAFGFDLKKLRDQAIKNEPAKKSPAKKKGRKS